MIEFKDFERKPKLGGLTSHPFESAVQSANEWASTEPGIQVINIETIWDTSSFLATDIVSTKSTGLRVWFIRRS